VKIFGSIQELVELVYRKGSNTVTLRPNTAQAANVTVSLPNLSADDTVVTETASQALSNKTSIGVGNFSISGNTISATAGITLTPSSGNGVFINGLVGVRSGNNLRLYDSDNSNYVGISVPGSLTADRNISIPDDTGNFVLTTATQTLTNKTISGSSNTLTNLPAASITGILPAANGGTGVNSSATFPSTGTVAVLTDISASQLSGIVPGSKGGTGVNNGGTLTYGTNNIALSTSGATSLTLPASGTLATLAGTEVLTNKDIDGGTASNTSRTTLPKANKSVLDGLTRKQATLVYGSDTNKVYADDGSTLKEIGSGSSGINYLNSQFNADALGTVEVSVGDTLTSTTRSNPNQWGNSTASALITQSTDSTLRGTTNYLVAFSANAQFVESPLFSIDGQDLGKPLLVQFDVSGVGTADDVQVYIARYNSSNVLQERIVIAGTASATSPNSAQVPTAVTTFRGFFIPSSTATDKYAIRWRRNANNTSMRLDTFIVGPQSLAQGAVVTAWQAYTPTFEGFGTTTGIDAKWRRVGSSLQAQIKFTSGTLQASTTARISIPSGLTIDSSIVNKIIGTSTTQFSVTSGQNNSCLIFVESGQTTNVAFCNIGDGSSTKNLSGLNSQTIFGSNAPQSVQFEVPISQWSSGTTTLADRAVEEYLSTSSFSSLTINRGPNGSTLPTTTPSGTFESISFGPNPWNTTWLPTDIVSIELDPFGNGKWTSISGSIELTSLTVQEASLTYIGLGFYFDGTNWILLRGKYRNPNSGNGVWSSASAGLRYRIKKVSSGAQVGYPISTKNIVGATDGVAPVTGMLGEVLVSTSTGTSAPAASGSWASIESLTLTKGTWMVSGVGFCYVSGGSTHTGWTAFNAGISTGPTLSPPDGYFAQASSPNGNNSGPGLTLPPRIITVSSDTQVVYLVARLDYSTIGSIVLNANQSQITAVRIA